MKSWSCICGVTNADLGTCTNCGRERIKPTRNELAKRHRAKTGDYVKFAKGESEFFMRELVRIKRSS